MCGISGVELAIIIVAAIIILGPEKLPDVLRMLARMTHHARSAFGDLQRVGKVLDKDFPRKELERTVREEILNPASNAGKPRPRQRARDARVEEQIDRIRRERERNAAGGAPTAQGESEQPPADLPDVAASDVAASTESTAPVAARPAAGAVPRSLESRSTVTAPPSEVDDDAT